jgi:hydrogenase expression/formation protein HypC
MCIGIPMKVIECNGIIAKCVGRGQTRAVNLALIGEQSVGTWVLMAIDSAREVLDEATANQINEALDGAELAINSPIDLSKYFPDLIGREPELPAFLKGN